MTTAQAVAERLKILMQAKNIAIIKMIKAFIK